MAPPDVVEPVDGEQEWVARSCGALREYKTWPHPDPVTLFVAALLVGYGRNSDQNTSQESSWSNTMRTQEMLPEMNHKREHILSRGRCAGRTRPASPSIAPKCNFVTISR